MIRKFKSRNVFYSLLIPLGLVFLPMIFLSLILYVQSNTKFRQQIVYTNEMMVAKVSSELDGIISSVSKLGVRVAFDDRVAKLVSDNDIDSNFTQMHFYDTVSRLKEHIINLDYIENIYLVFDNTDTVISNCGVMKKDIFYYSYYRNSGLNFEEWEAFILNEYRANLSEMKYEDGAELLYLQSLPINSRGRSRATLGIVINKKKFMQTINLPENEKFTTIYIFDENRCILSMGEEIDIVFNNALLEQLSDEGSVNYQKYVLTKRASRESRNLKYISVMTKKSYWSDIPNIYLVFLALLLLEFIFGTVVIIGTSRKNYNIVKSLRDKLNSMLDIDSDSDENEYQQINKRLDLMQSKAAFAEKTIRMQDFSLQNIHFKELLLGRSTYNSKYFAEHGFFGSTEQGAIAVVRYEGGEAAADYLSFMEVAEELCTEESLLATVSVDAETYCLIVMQEEEAERIAEHLIAGLGLRREECAVGISAAEWQNISNAYYMTIGSIYGMAGKTVLCDSQLEMKMNLREIVTVKNNMINQIHSANFADAMTLLRRFFVECGLDSMNEINRTNIKFQIFNIFAEVLDEYSNVSLEIKQSMLSQFFAANYAGEIRLVAENMLKTVCTAAMEKKEHDAKNDFVNKVIEYIAENYDDEKLNVAEIGYHFNLTPHYVSKKFAEQTGKSLKSYITEHRISRARYFLTEKPEMKLSDIALACGFANDSIFSKTFKKSEGIPPGKYRESYMK